MTISSAVPAEIAERMQDEREERLERVCDRHKEQAKENLEARMLSAWNPHLKLSPALDIAGEALAMMNHFERERFADAMWQRDACALGEVFLPVMERYISEYFADHPDDIDEECKAIALGGDCDE